MFYNSGHYTQCPLSATAAFHTCARFIYGNILKSDGLMPGRYEGWEVTCNPQLYESDTTDVLCGFVYSFRIRVLAVINSGCCCEFWGAKFLQRLPVELSCHSWPCRHCSFILLISRYHYDLNFFTTTLMNKQRPNISTASVEFQFCFKISNPSFVYSNNS